MNLNMHFDMILKPGHINRNPSPVLKFSKIYIMRDLEQLPTMPHPEASHRISENESGDHFSEC
jgi:hypothetical protein